jgi:hypothetical protein
MPKKAPANFEAESAVVATARAREGVERDNELAGLRVILQDAQVRDFLWRLMEYTQMFSDPMQANFGIVGHNLGRAAVGKWVMNEVVEADPNAWLVMQQTHYQKQIEKAAIAASADAERASSEQ